ncbi:MAG TPA: hypothetical protein PKJ84_09680 [Anaerolineales bacterium]|nr:hypothetical protein [Anaerolineales bacterium]
MTKNEKLQEYFNFTQSDLQENRQGQVSEDQRLIVKNRAQRFNNNILIVLVFILVISAGAAAFTRKAVLSASGFPFSPALLGPGITIVIMTVYMLNRSKKKSDFSLHKAEGTVNFVWVEERVRNHSNSGPDYKTVRSLQMRVGGESFNVREELMDIINQGDNARFYYTGGGDIVSAEFVGKP